MAWQPDYCELEDLKEYLRIQALDTVDDTQLALAIAAASRSVDMWCSGAVERQFGLTAPEERSYRSRYYDGCRYLYVYEIDDLMVTTNLVVTADGTVTDDYTLEPLNAPQKGKPYTRIVLLASESLAVSGSWGWSSIPTPVTQATLLQAARIVMRRQAPFGISGSPQEQGELRLLARIDPDVQVILTPYRRAGGVG